MNSERIEFYYFVRKLLIFLFCLNRLKCSELCCSTQLKSSFECFYILVLTLHNHTNFKIMYSIDEIVSFCQSQSSSIVIIRLIGFNQHQTFKRAQHYFGVKLKVLYSLFIMELLLKTTVLEEFSLITIDNPSNNSFLKNLYLNSCSELFVFF